MTKRDLVSTALIGAVAAVITSAGAQFAFAAESHPVNPAPVAPAATPASFADIVQRVAPAVVSVDVEQKADVHAAGDFGPQEGPPQFFFGQPGEQNGQDPFEQFRRFFQQRQGPQSFAPIRGTGSGFFISADGYIVTNNHVVDGATKITVRTADERTLPAHLVGRDPATDLAVIKVDGGNFPFVSFEDRAQPRVGDWVVAVGNPFNLGGTATAGIVSALKRPNVSGSSYVDYMQIDAPINRGNSGGPTFDLYGRVVGVNSAIFTPSGGSVGIGFDIPAAVAARVSHQLISEGKVTRGYIGASVQDITPDIAASLGVPAHSGALVAEVVDGGPSDKAGLASGDLVQKIDGRPLTSASDLTRAVAMVEPGKDLTLTVRHEGHEKTVTLRAGTRPSEKQLADNSYDPGNGSGGADEGRLGLAVAPHAGGGVQVQSVDPSSDAAAKGLRPGDVIERADGRKVSAAGDITAELDAQKKAGRDQVLLLVARNGRETFVPVKVGSDSEGG